MSNCQIVSTTEIFVSKNSKDLSVDGSLFNMSIQSTAAHMSRISP